MAPQKDFELHAFVASSCHSMLITFTISCKSKHLLVSSENYRYIKVVFFCVAVNFDNSSHSRCTGVKRSFPLCVVHACAPGRIHVASYPGLPSQLFLQPWKKSMGKYRGYPRFFPRLQKKAVREGLGTRLGCMTVMFPNLRKRW